jgi:O-antigen ligase
MTGPHGPLTSRVGSDPSLLVNAPPSLPLNSKEGSDPTLLVNAAPASQRVALRVLQIGAIAIVLAATAHEAFDLDRFLVPKELVLHVTAVIAGVFTLRGSRRDRLLLLFLALSVASATFATNHWVAFRALAVSASSVSLFWSARRLRESGLQLPLVNALAVGIVAAAITSLLQAYGVWLPVFAENRAPGGTIGNRNFVAHAAAFGFPVLLFAALNARRFVYGAAGVTIVTAALVLTRSRAAWLGFAAMLLVFFIVAPLRKRVLGLIAFAAIGVAAALLIPNTLRWRSDNPYLESVKGVVNYEEGSGRGRLIQYTESLQMALRYPILGVGPGNWAVVYPKHATRNDPSLDQSEGGMTTNPWPSSDWVAFVAERGVVTAIVLALFFLTLARDAFRSPDRLGAAAGLATLAAALVAGAFDAVLLLALPAFFFWVASGALVVAPVRVESRRWSSAPIALAVLAVSALGAVYSGAKLASIHLYSEGSITRAAQVDPGNYRAQIRLARSGKRKVRCEHARAAFALHPHATAARESMRGCGDS